MTGSVAFDIVIGLVLIFALYSLFASAINESISTMFSDRARMLERGLEQMLDGKNYRYTLLHKIINFFMFLFSGKLCGGKNFLLSTTDVTVKRRLKLNSKARLFASQVVNHPLYLRKAENSLFSTKPSYLEPDCFADILVDLLSMKKSATGLPVQLKDITDTIDQDDRLNGSTKDILRIYIDQSNGDMNRFRSLVQTWFNETMDRVSGWYKRGAQQWLCIIGFVMAVSFNADVFDIVDQLSTNEAVRTMLVQQAEKVSQDTSFTSSTDSLQKRMVRYRGEVASVNQTLGLGWKGRFLTGLTGKKVLGFVLMALAIGLGAPFWFELLSKLVNLRGSGLVPKEEKSGKTAKETVSKRPKLNSSF